MRKIKFFIFALVAILVVAGCTKNGTSNDQSTAMDNSGSSDGTVGKDNGNAESGEKTTEINMSDFFLEDGAKAHFKGIGNEFAELDVEVSRPFEDYIVIHENNGGSLIRYIYKIEPDAIRTIAKKTIDLEEDFPSHEELDAMKPTGTYLKKPLEKGTTFDNWKIVETDVTVETPYKKFDHAIVIESQDQDIITRKYFVEGFGEVKRESIMAVEGEKDFTVISTLEAIDE
ncbi:lipoprotein [Filibacter tadaridae]|uniref:Uncharacterized protein n=1 Tax=Filibacter tadaridae TaxID=2483811 RepID=A0A3P5X3W7_9BACL|nr:lipoprotein [Filibacter tadaridae]VDC28970.1 hypothetical protein FILTAD_01928 [Filibacter tadaridae]